MTLRNPRRAWCKQLDGATPATPCGCQEDAMMHEDSPACSGAASTSWLPKAFALAVETAAWAVVLTMVLKAFAGA